MRRLLVVIACVMFLCLPLEAQVKCTSSKTTRLIAKPYTWAAGKLTLSYTSADSVAANCTNFPTTDTAAISLLTTSLKATQDTLAAYKDTVTQLRTTTTSSPPPPDTTTPPPAGTGTMFFNSAEAGCGTDANVLLCDDFEDGWWYEKNCDVANASGGLQQVDGWCGTIFSLNGNQSSAAICGGKGAGGTNCAATSGPMTKNQQGGYSMADHNLSRAVKELWLRYYIWTSPDHVFGSQKMITINSTTAGSGGISIGGSGSPFGDGAYDTCPVYDCNILDPSNGGVYYYRQNQGSVLKLNQIPGHWAFVEMHIKLNTPGVKDGAFDLWINDCGTDGKSCGASPILRSHYTTVQWLAPGDNKQIVSLWFENWANPASSGTEYYDQIVARSDHSIGFMK